MNTDIGQDLTGGYRKIATSFLYDEPSKRECEWRARKVCYVTLLLASVSFASNDAILIFNSVSLSGSEGPFLILWSCSCLFSAASFSFSDSNVWVFVRNITASCSITWSWRFKSKFCCSLPLSRDLKYVYKHLFYQTCNCVLMYAYRILNKYTKMS